MSATIYLESFSALLPRGIVTPAGTAPWNRGQTGPADVTREQVLDKPYLSFGKLSLPDRLAFSAAALIFSTYPCEDHESAGICLGLPAGSLSTDLRYMESVLAGYPSPSLFSATLPSSAIADIAIVFGLKGENRVIAGDAGSGLVALDCACAMLSAGKVSSALVLSVNAVEGKDFSSPLLPSAADFDAQNRAYAFLLSAKRRTQGLACAITASFGPANKDLPYQRGELYFYELSEILLHRGAGSIECFAPDISGRITISRCE
jgi:Beta-ketoacyl synthase, N-terminal domain